MRMSNRRIVSILMMLVLVPMVAAVANREHVLGRFLDPPMSITVDLSERQLMVYKNGELTETYGVAVGRDDFPTPTGSFQTGKIEWGPRWVPPKSDWARDEIPREAGDPENPMQGVKIYFQYPDYYIHGTNAPGSIGTAASHGCLRMNVGDAMALASEIEQYGSVPMTIQQ